MEGIGIIEDTDAARGKLAEILGRRGVSFERPDAWQLIEEHVGTHKYLLDVRTKDNVKWGLAAESWMTSVAAPLLDALNRHDPAVAFPERAVGDLLIEISDHWYFLKQEHPGVSPDEAVESFARQFGTTQNRRGLGFALARGFRSIVDALRDGGTTAALVAERRSRHHEELLARDALEFPNDSRGKPFDALH